jgi:alpha,alpha-trehalase
MQTLDPTSLFHQIQMNAIFPDGKTFVDCVPLDDMETIEENYQAQKDNADFNLADFVNTHFELPENKAAAYQSDVSKPIEAHLNSLWSVLTRQADEAGGTLIPLRHPYVVPGGRFREIYYWDSYFTMLGLKASGEYTLMQNMVDNFADLIDAFGYIPNGNRAYYLGRSQPPFFALMLTLLSEVKGKSVLTKYLAHLEDEWVFWNQSDLDDETKGVSGKSVKLSEDVFQLRYFDANETPRPESYREDVELANHSKQEHGKMYQHLRAAAESGWDFSHRWFEDANDFATIHTTDILPVDLNCLNYFLTDLLASLYAKKRDADSKTKAQLFQVMATSMKENIHQLYWNEMLGFFTDYDFVKEKQRDILTLAGVFPLFFGIATKEQAASVAHILETQFLKNGGLSTTLVHSGQQWDAPNGWAPLQWMAYKGLQRYGHDKLADEVRQRWLNTCEKVYQKTGKMTEKYDVWQQDVAASGGEYPNQDGFGWTNGVYLAMKNA